MGEEHSILLAIMIFLIFQNSPKQENSLYQQFSESVGLIGFDQFWIYFCILIDANLWYSLQCRLYIVNII